MNLLIWKPEQLLVLIIPYSQLFFILSIQVFVNVHFQEEGASSLAQDLQAQIDETLEEISPRYVLELLALPLGEDFCTKRAEDLQAVCNLLCYVFRTGPGLYSAAVRV